YSYDHRGHLMRYLVMRSRPVIYDMHSVMHFSFQMDTIWCVASILSLLYLSESTTIAMDDNGTSPTYLIEGQAILPPTINAKPDWHTAARVLVNYGQHIAFVKRDGSFVVSGIPPGSYIVEVSHVNFVFEPVRVDITSKGKFRARRLNLLQ
uniref:ER membrane protein complex subunit 7 beta-sandwich domain-containing protein n=1 Tax=Parascaris univalens TaxID=6257 RepID=A0A915CEF6_PARUN